MITSKQKPASLGIKSANQKKYFRKTNSSIDWWPAIFPAIQRSVLAVRFLLYPLIYASLVLICHSHAAFMRRLADAFIVQRIRSDKQIWPETNWQIDTATTKRGRNGATNRQVNGKPNSALTFEIFSFLFFVTFAGTSKNLSITECSWVKKSQKKWRTQIDCVCVYITSPGMIARHRQPVHNKDKWCKRWAKKTGSKRKGKKKKRKKEEWTVFDVASNCEPQRKLDFFSSSVFSGLFIGRREGRKHQGCARVLVESESRKKKRGKDGAMEWWEREREREREKESSTLFCTLLCIAWELFANCVNCTIGGGTGRHWLTDSDCVQCASAVVAALQRCLSKMTKARTPRKRKKRKWLQCSPKWQVPLQWSSSSSRSRQAEAPPPASRS